MLPPSAALNVPLPTAQTLHHEGIHEPASSYGVASNLEDNLRNGELNLQDAPAYENRDYVNYNNVPHSDNYNYGDVSYGGETSPRDSYRNDYRDFQSYNNYQPSSNNYQVHSFDNYRSNDRQRDNNQFQSTSFSQLKAIDIIGPSVDTLSPTTTYSPTLSFAPSGPSRDFGNFAASQQNGQLAQSEQAQSIYGSSRFAGEPTTGPSSYPQSASSNTATTVIEKFQAIDKTEEYSQNAIKAFESKESDKQKIGQSIIRESTSSPSSIKRPEEDVVEATLASTTEEPVFGQRLVPKKPRNKHSLISAGFPPRKTYLPPKRY